MTRHYRLLLVFYVTLLVFAFATPTFANKQDYTDTQYTGETYCCSDISAAETCLINVNNAADAAFCFLPPNCNPGACPKMTPSKPQAAAVAELKSNGELCNNSSECISNYCNSEDTGDTKATGVCENPITLAPGQKPTPAGSSGGGEPVESIKLPNFLFTEDPNDVIGRVIEFVIGLAGTAALAMFIYGGVRWLTSGGREDFINKGREAMQWAAIGLIIVFSSYVLVKFVLQVIGSSAGA